MTRLTGFLLFVLVLAFAAGADATLSDPYKVLQKHYEAMGGLDKIKAQKSNYAEGTIDLEGTGLKGTFRNWQELPIRSRQEVDLTVITQTSGDNGEYAWSVDHNGKLQIARDETTAKTRKVQILTAQYEHLDPDSKVFSLTLEGIENVEEADCYVLRLANNINEIVTINYYDTATFFMVRSDVIMPDGQSQTVFGDYREVDGVQVSFRQTVSQLPTGMKQIVEITKFENNPAIDPELFQPPAADVRDFTFLDGKSSVEVPFQFIENHLYLYLTVGGLTRRWALDTGASVTVLDETFAKELGLEMQGELKGQGASNVVDFSFATMPAFSLPGLQFQEQQVAVIDISPLLRKSVGFDIAGIIGFDFLSRLVIRVDYAAETLTLYDPDSFSYNGDGVVIDAPLESNMFYLPVTVDGRYEGMWNLDLGAGGCDFHYHYAAEQGFLDRKGVDVLSFGAGGSQESRRLRFNSIELAGYTVPNPIIDIQLTEGQGAFANKRLAGNIGNTLLRHLVLYLDYKHEQVIVEKGGDFEKVFGEDHTGMQVINNLEDQLELIVVAKGTPSEKAGLKVGDIVTGINGVKAEYLGGIVSIRKMLREPVGTEYKVDVLRDGKPQTVKLVLGELFD